MESRHTVFVVRRPDATGDDTVVVDGMRMTTRNDMFAEFATALRFPDYFGMNWDAFADCISDALIDRGKVTVPLLVAHASRLLSDAPDEEFITFIDILTTSEPGRAWFAVSLADDEAGIAQVEERLRRTRLPFTS